MAFTQSVSNVILKYVGYGWVGLGAVPLWYMDQYLYLNTRNKILDEIFFSG